MKKTSLKLRKGMTRPEQAEVRANLPDTARARWLDRMQAADVLDVHVRTIDRHIRLGRLTGWRGALGTRLNPVVLVWAADVTNWEVLDR